LRGKLKRWKGGDSWASQLAASASEGCLPQVLFFGSFGLSLSLLLLLLLLLFFKQ
jgi:hypothetical protein